MGASKTGSRDLFEDEVLVHIEHLFSVLMDGHEDCCYELKFWEVGSEYHEAEKIRYENQGGVALERRVRTGEWNFAEAQEKKFNESNRARGKDDGVQKRGAEAPEESGRDKTNWHERD